MPTNEQLVLEAIRTETAIGNKVTRKSLVDITGLSYELIKKAVRDGEKLAKIYEENGGLYISKSELPLIFTINTAIDHLLITLLDAKDENRDEYLVAIGSEFVQAKIQEIKQLLGGF